MRRADGGAVHHSSDERSDDANNYSFASLPWLQGCNGYSAVLNHFRKLQIKWDEPEMSSSILVAMARSTQCATVYIVPTPLSGTPIQSAVCAYCTSNRRREGSSTSSVETSN